MYSPPAYVTSERALLDAFMRKWNFATLVTLGAEGVNATHLPFLVRSPVGENDNGRLIAHLAKANPQYGDLCAGREALVLFQGPHAFVSPGWYANQLTFPTWNYTAVHVRGTPRVFEDAEGMRHMLDDMVQHHDAPTDSGWQFDAMPPELVSTRMRVIAGVEITVRTIEGKMKLNQDKTPADREGVIAALEQQADPRSLEVAALMRQLPDLKF
jgi:transcriptional regulator